MVEIRVTKPVLYCDEGCPGERDTTGRQGYYFKGETVEEAIRKACEKHPQDILDVESGGKYHGRYLTRFPGEPDAHVVRLPGEPTRVCN